MRKIFTLLLLSYFIGYSLIEGGEQELVVLVETENQLIPISIAALASKSSGFSNEYLRKLENIFRFDFDNNGITAISQDKEVPVLYHFELAMKEHKLYVTAADLAEGKETCFGEVLFTGYLADDRRILHKLADKIQEHFFGVGGIASTRIIYTIKKSGSGDDISEVWEADYDGGNAKQMTKNSGYCVTPGYIPPKPGYAAGSFVYTGYKTGQPKIYVASLEEGTGKLLLTLPGNQLMPAVSRQRDKIAFISDVTGNPDLFLQDFDPEKGVSGKPRHLFTAPNATQGTPTFSPDGTRIAFVSNKSGSPMIYVIKIPPSGTPLKEIKPQLISKFTKDNTAPSWSPDGTKIAYCAKINGIRQIFVYDFLTGLERQLTTGNGNKENPSWAPNSLHLVYNTSDAKSCELFLINLKQLHAVKITSGNGEKRFPSWEPRTGA
jgi:TolB protein